MSEIIIAKPAGVVWERLSDPLNYPVIYPNWVKTAAYSHDNVFRIEDQFGGVYNIELLKNKEFGAIDLRIGDELSQTRVFPAGADRAVVVHLAKRWRGCGYFVWFLTEV